MTATWELSSPLYFEHEVDPDGTLDPYRRHRLARQRHAEAVRQAEAELSEIDSPDSISPADWRWDALISRVRAEADRRTAQTGDRVPAAIVWAAVEALDLVLEGLAQANIRPEDAAPFADLPAMCLSAVGTAWAAAEERFGE